MNLLVIGNSFSEDTTYYLHQMAQTVGEQMTVVNLYIPGCTLAQHWENITNNQAAYRYEKNGYYALEDTGTQLVSIASVLAERTWDHIVSQQASHESGRMASYQPFAAKIYAYLSEQAPTAKLWLQETWAYEIDSLHPQFSWYESDQRVMFNALKKCYHQVAKELDLPLILTGEVIQAVRVQSLFDYQHGGLSLCRDGYHLSYVYGRYLASLVWLQTFYGAEKVSQLSYLPTSRFEEGFEVNEIYLNKLKSSVLTFYKLNNASHQPI